MIARRYAGRPGERSRQDDAGREYLKGRVETERSYSIAVSAFGKRTIYVSGIAAWEDETGKSLAGDFNGQTRVVFGKLRQILETLGATLDDIVSMSVFVTDMQYGQTFTKIRKEYFIRDYPASALIGIKELARPPMMIEIQATAVTD
ncbi:MAG TPA: RidA family protein [Candidatus Binatia bacterium]